MENIILIISGGEVTKEVVDKVLKQNHFTSVIVADGGLTIADKLNLSIDYLVGDFDSVNQTLLKKYKERIEQSVITTRLREFKPEKDSTDTHIAINLAIELKATKIIILGATGTRLDHTLANINLLMIPLKYKIDAEIIDMNNHIFLMDGSIVKKKILNRHEISNKYISLLPLTNEVTKVTLFGFKYPLKDRTLTIGDSLGISNELLEDMCEIRIDKGILIVIQSSD